MAADSAGSILQRAKNRTRLQRDVGLKESERELRAVHEDASERALCSRSRCYTICSAVVVSDTAVDGVTVEYIPCRSERASESHWDGD